MRIACPSCSSAYDVPDERLKPGRRVRCAQCHAEWVPTLTDPDLLDEEALASAIREEEPVADRLGSATGTVPAPVATAMERLAANPAAKRSTPLLWAAWVASIVILAFGLMTCYTDRDAVMRLWPPSVHLYSALGLAANAAVPQH
jgi:predicted Zn finger-like uncharacterized protein